MLILASANHQVDQLLERLCIELAITETQYLRAKRAYETVGAWLSVEGTLLSRFEPQIYPQGSIPLGTTVKPRNTEEFDADGVCLLTRGYHGLTSQQVYDLVLLRIAEHDTYRSKISKQDRCIRLEYEDRFHLDIVPAIPATPWDATSTRISIPTQDRQGWQSSDPKGYEAWFRSRQILRQMLTEKRADAEPMPPNTDPENKSSLQRIAQLFKRRRDVYFNGNSRAPKSILMTTLAASHYGGMGLVTDGTIHVLKHLLHLPPNAPPRVDNPSNPGENLARHWDEDPRNYQAFLGFCRDFLFRMEQLLQVRGMENIVKVLQEMFDPLGSGAVTRAVTSYTEAFQAARNTNSIQLTSKGNALSTGVAAGIAIPRNSFFGDHDGTSTKKPA